RVAVCTGPPANFNRPLQPITGYLLRRLRENVVLAKRPLSALAVAFAPDGDHLAAFGQDGTVRLLAFGDLGEVHSWATPYRIPSLETWAALELAFSRDSGRLALGDRTDGRVAVAEWDTGTGAVLADHAWPVRDLFGVPDTGTADALRVGFHPEGHPLAAV